MGIDAALKISDELMREDRTLTQKIAFIAQEIANFGLSAGLIWGAVTATVAALGLVSAPVWLSALAVAGVAVGSFIAAGALVEGFQNVVAALTGYQHPNGDGPIAQYLLNPVIDFTADTIRNGFGLVRDGIGAGVNWLTSWFRGSPSPAPGTGEQTGLQSHILPHYSSAASKIVPDEQPEGGVRGTTLAAVSLPGNGRQQDPRVEPSPLDISPPSA